jgi:hypothetical protein
MHTLELSNKQLKNIYKQLYDIMNKCRLLALRNATNKWRFNTHKCLKDIIAKSISEKESKESSLKDTQFINRIHMKALKLLIGDYKTAEDIVRCKDLLTIINEVKGYLNKKTSVTTSVFTLHFPILNKEQSLGPYLILDNDYRSHKVNKSQNMVSMQPTEVFKSVNLVEHFITPSLTLDDPIISLLNNGYNYYKPNAEPYLSAMKKRRIESMDHGIALALPQGTIELYWNCLSNVFTKVFLLVTIG